MPTQCDLYKKTLEEKFLDYHAANPQVFSEFVKLAERAKAEGRRHFGAKFLLEKIRWDSPVAAQDLYKVNNNFPSRYVRLLAKTRPDLAIMFATRKLKA